MDTIALLSPELQRDFRRILELRQTIEACGLLLPTPHEGKLLWEMPNRSKRAQNSFEMKSSDVHFSLSPWIEANPTLLTQVTFWHTHPSGDARPSNLDMEHRVENALNLVLGINNQGRLTYSWY